MSSGTPGMLTVSPGVCGGVDSDPVVCHHDDGWERNVHMTMVDLKKHGGISKAQSDLQRVPLNRRNLIHKLRHMDPVLRSSLTLPQALHLSFPHDIN